MGGKWIIPGERFGRLVTVNKVYKGTRVYWQSLCDCGTTTVVMGSSLRYGSTTSCGCYARELNDAKRKGPPPIPIFSDEDSDLRSLIWQHSGHGYARRRIAHKHRFAHHDVILRIYGRLPDPASEVTDHKNRNKLDNRRENLHITSYSENTRNRAPRPKGKPKFRSRIRLNGVLHQIGSFDTPEEAKNAVLQFLKDGTTARRRKTKLHPNPSPQTTTVTTTHNLRP